MILLQIIKRVVCGFWFGL